MNESLTVWHAPRQFDIIVTECVCGVRPRLAYLSYSSAVLRFMDEFILAEFVWNDID